MALPNQDQAIDTAFGGLANPSVVHKGCINDLLICTYNESHVVAGGKYFRHLKKCAEVNGNRDPEFQEKLDKAAMRRCPFDNGHEIHQSVLFKHIALCDGHFQYQMDNQVEPPSMRVKLDRYKLPGVVDEEKEVRKRKYTTESAHEPDESADEESSEVSTYASASEPSEDGMYEIIRAKRETESESEEQDLTTTTSADVEDTDHHTEDDYVYQRVDVEDENLPTWDDITAAFGKVTVDTVKTRILKFLQDVEDHAPETAPVETQVVVEKAKLPQGRGRGRGRIFANRES